MNRIELRYAIYQALIGPGQPAAIKSAVLIGPVPAEPGAVIEVTTDDPFNIADPDAVRRYRVTVEEVTD